MILHFNIFIFIYFLFFYSNPSHWHLSLPSSSVFCRRKCNCPTFCLYIRGSKFSLSPLDCFMWGEKRNSLSANDFSSFLNGWKVIPYELLQHRHSYFIVLAALSLIVAINGRCQCYFFVSVQAVPTGVSWGGAKAVSETLLMLNERKWNRWWFHDQHAEVFMMWNENCCVFIYSPH